MKEDFIAPFWMQEVEVRLKRKNQILFSKDSTLLRELRLEIARQNRRALVLWALELTEQAVLMFEQKHPTENRPRTALITARAWAEGQIKMPIARRAILDCHAVAKELSEPVEIARSHAIAQGCSVVHTTDHALGLPMYELTAIILEKGLSHYKEAVEERSRFYMERLHYWQQAEQQHKGPWAGFLMEIT